MPKTKSIPAQLRTILEKSGKSYYQISKETGMYESTLANIKSKDWGTQLETAQRVLNAVGYQLKIEPL